MKTEEEVLKQILQVDELPKHRIIISVTEIMALMATYHAQFPSPSVNEEIIKKQDEIIKHQFLYILELNMPEIMTSGADKRIRDLQNGIVKLESELTSLKSQSKESLTDDKGVSDLPENLDYGRD
jgi:hypothetical protein